MSADVNGLKLILAFSKLTSPEQDRITFITNLYLTHKKAWNGNILKVLSKCYFTLFRVAKATVAHIKCIPDTLKSSTTPANDSNTQTAQVFSMETGMKQNLSLTSKPCYPLRTSDAHLERKQRDLFVDCLLIYRPLFEKREPSREVWHHVIKKQKLTYPFGATWM